MLSHKVISLSAVIKKQARPALQHVLVVLFILAMLASCNSAAPTPKPNGALSPSPTIAAAAPVVAPAPAPAPVVRPTATPRPAQPIATANPAVFNYFWPAVLPVGMQPAPKESRVARDNEVGTNAPGFYLVTFNADGGKRKIILGGGAVEPFNLSGETKQIEVDGRTAKLITNGEQRLLVFTTNANQGTLFLFGIGVGEADLLQAADSLLPIELPDMRARVGL